MLRGGFKSKTLQLFSLVGSCTLFILRYSHIEPRVVVLFVFTIYATSMGLIGSQILITTVYYLGCRIVSLPSNTDFMIFNHRGKIFPVEVNEKLRH
ncbi:membrane magnesium transporter [Trifolium repens]|nr:membrane magnesium transporter [Trifolium repens]